MISGDPTGRKGIAANVLASWGGQSVFILAGFILPRLIDRKLGQNQLGVWDFAWSIVSYFSLVQVGIVGSISRYVAMCRAKDDLRGLNRVTSSVTCVLLPMAGAILLLTAVALLGMGAILGHSLGTYLSEARCLVLLLGIEISAQTAFSVYGGVITGHHRWILQNWITAVSYLFAASGMVAALVIGGGVRWLALVHLTAEIFAGTVRCLVAHHICPGLRIRFANADRETAWEMIRYGTKSWVPSIGDLLLNQTTSVLITACLGPASLAVYSRSRSLVRSSRDLIMKMAGVLVASVSALHFAGKHSEIQYLLIRSTRYSAFLAFPMAMLLIIVGGPILNIWMGSSYAASWVVGTLAIAQTSAVLQLPGSAILAGMNRHGHVAVANLVASMIALIAVIVCLSKLKLGLTAAALAASIPPLTINSIYGPIHTCRRLGLPVSQYIRQALLFPFMRTTPFAAALLWARWQFGGNLKLVLVVGISLGSALLSVTYWKNVVPGSVKAILRRNIPWRRRLALPVVPEA